MLRHFSFAVATAAVAAVSLAAQGTTATSSSSTPGTQAPGATSPATAAPNTAAPAAPGAAASTANHVTATGCLERADQFASAAKNPVGDPDSLQYVLVRPKPEQSNSGAATAAAVGTTGTQSPVMYRLSGDQQKLNPLVGHKVEITGTAVPMAARPSATAGATGASAPMPVGPAPGLNVQSVRMVDASCSAK